MMNTEEGRDQLKKDLNLCHMIAPNDPNSRGSLIDSLVGPFLNTAQYGGNQRVCCCSTAYFNMNNMFTFTVKQMQGKYAVQTMENLCGIMTNTNRTLIQRLVDVNQWLSGDTRKWACIDNSYIETVDALREMNDRKTLSQFIAIMYVERGWQYQTCTEFGFFQTTTLPTLPFGGNNVNIE
jgi:hypothetical protein